MTEKVEFTTIFSPMLLFYSFDSFRGKRFWNQSQTKFDMEY